MSRDEQLLNCIAGGRVPHAILVAGPAGGGRTLLARRAAAVYCLGEDAPERLGGCPNFIALAGASVGVRQVRELMAVTAAQAFNGGRRAFLLADAHKMAQQSQNALLKTLEEPPADTLILLTGNESGLLPTVRSRCMIWRLGARPLETVIGGLTAQGVSPDVARRSARAADGVPGLALEYASETGSVFRTEAAALLERALFEACPFAPAEALLLEDTAREGRKRRPDSEKLRGLLIIWESVARDALARRGGMPDSAALNADFCALSARIAAAFTDAQIQGIIDLLGTVQKRLGFRASPGLLLDVMLAKLGGIRIGFA